MGWDSEFFLPRNSIFRSQIEAGKKTNQETRFIHCAECNVLIGAVSTTIYEIEEKHYCSGCYSRKIISLAVERDHSDLKQAKRARK